MKNFIMVSKLTDLIFFFSIPPPDLMKNEKIPHHTTMP